MNNVIGWMSTKNRAARAARFSLHSFVKLFQTTSLNNQIRGSDDDF